VYADTETVGLGNSGVVLLDDRTIVVDAQYAAPARTLRSNIEKISARRITHLLLTHSHSDHVFGNEVFQDCEIVAHESLRTRMEELSRTTWSKESLQQQVATLKETNPDRAARFENVHLVLPTKTFQDKFQLGEGTFKVEMIHTGGHTADSSIVYYPHEGMVFAGDSIFSGIYPYGADPTADPDLWIEALNRIRSLSPKAIVPGHGPICGIDEVDKYVSYISETKSVMLKLIAENKPENQVITDSSLPRFYEEGAGDRRPGSLGQWYRVWKQRTGKPVIG
jgi:cyclase